MEPTFEARRHAREEYQKNRFAQAVEEVISEIKSQNDPFFKEITTQFGASLLEDDPQWSLHCAEGIANSVKSLEQKQKSDSKTLGLVGRLQPFVSSLSMYTKAFDVALQAGPAPAAIIYGGARLVLQQLEDFSNCFETVIGIMERIGTLLQCYDLFSSAYQSSEPIQEALFSSYKNIVLFWQKAYKFFKRKAPKTLLLGFLKPLEGKWEKCQHQLELDSEIIKTLSQATEGVINKDARQNERRRQIADWIKAGEDDRAFNVRLNLADNLELQQAGTCSWLYDQESFQSWYAASTSITAWYHAPAGAGKTVLAASLIKFLQNQKDKKDKKLKTVYWFCSFNDPTRRNPLNFLRSIALQLITALGGIPDEVLDIFQVEVDNHAASLHDHMTALKLVQALLFKCDRVHIVVDGLDECHDRHRLLLLATLFELSKSKLYGVVKWFFTSRNEPDIVPLMREAKAIEIQPSREFIEHDIKLFLKDRMTPMDKCIHQIDYWTTAAEGNFLWSRLMLQIMKGDESSCEEEIDEALKKFPKGLTGCYARSLEQLSEMLSPAHQELARRIFMTLVIARQPLHLSELANLLAVRKGAEDHSDKRVPEAQRIEQICGKFVTFDRSSKNTASDPLLKFFHKSVYEFFVQDPETLRVSPGLKKYFVRADEAHRDMGEICVSYLSYARYSLPVDSDEILGNKEHAFLKYAATFWFQHLHWGTHSQEVYEKVCEFVQSPGYWNCMAIQTKIDPYLFSIYSHQGGMCYKMGASENEESIGEDGNNYANPLPSWLDEYGSLGKCIVEALHNFTKEWSPVLRRYPEAIDQCMMRASNMQDFPARVKFQARRVRRFNMQDLYPAGGEQLGAVRRSDHFQPNSSNTRLSWSTLDTGVSHDWSLDLRSLKLIHLDEDGENELISPKSISQLAIDSTESNEKSWTVIATDVYEYSAYGGVVALHCLLAPRGKASHHDGSSDSGYESADSKYDSDDSDEDSDDSASDDSDEDSDDTDSDNPDEDSDDSDSDDSDEDIAESESGSEGDSSTAEDAEAPIAENDIPYCLVLLPKNGKPIWSLSSRAREKRQEFVPAFHPSQQVAVWSQVAHELKIADLKTGSVRTAILPEPGDAQLSSAAIVHRDFRFSANEKLLHYLVCSFASTENGTMCTLSFSSFDWPQLSETKSLQRFSPPQKITYRFAGSLSTTKLCSIVTTYWASKYVYIALPPLSCKPKLVRLALPKEDANPDPDKAADFQTLKAPVYFPALTPERKPKIAIHEHTFPSTDGSKPKKRDLLVLVLNASSSCSPSPEDSCPQQEEASPDIFTWTISKRDGWRDWDTSSDECTTELEEKEEEHRRLRGSFISEEQRCSVPIRSGLDWTRKAFLSCG